MRRRSSLYVKQTHGVTEILTEWLYGTTAVAPSLIARNDLVKEKKYPDHPSNPVKYFYNQLGEVIEMHD